ncbi:GNAT family N-acetyltransferase [Sphingomonas sp. QA11]|nr:GNAT family protein [Sphingomonas sp. QA11]WCM29994.1 GNAT family N-acetyltransferase [Sphingomonas sp. QA11]
MPFAPEHFSVLSSWFSSERNVVQWGGPLVRFPISNEQLSQMLEGGQSTPPARLCWMLEEAGALLGHAQLSFDWRNGNALLSRVAIAPKARGRRLSRPMLQLVVQEAFSYQVVHRLELNVFTWNTPAIRTYEGLGFRLEGTRRESTLVDGERWDTAIMAMLRDEFIPSML